MQESYDKKPLHIQLADRVKQERIYSRLRLSDQPNKSILVRHEQNRIVRLGDELEFFRYLKDLISKYLNYHTFSQFEDHAPDGIDVDGIYIRRKDIENAEKHDFSLKRELRLLQDELDLDPDFIEAEKIPGQYELPFNNGVVFFDKGRFEDSSGLILHRINADYSLDFASEELPSKFTALLKSGVTNHGLSEAENNDRVNSMLDCLAYIFFPGNSLRKIFFVVDKSCSFQNTLCEIMKRILGSYAASLIPDPDKLVKKNRRNQDPLFNPKLIQGFLWIDAMESGEIIFDTRLIKSITDDPLTATIKTAYGKVFILLDSIPRFECHDEDVQPLKDRLVIIEWNDAPFDTASPSSSLVEELTTPEMQSRIVSWLVSKAFHLSKNGKFDLRIPESFQFKHSIRAFDQWKIADIFLNEVLCVYTGGTFDCEPRYPICASDVFKVYTNWICHHYLPIDKLIGERPFSMYLSKYLGKFALVEKKRYPNGCFYSGVMINPECITFQLRIPQTGNWHKNPYK
jgi:hypothetical protein